MPTPSSQSRKVSAPPVSVRLRRYFITGLATIFPVVVTLYALWVTFRFADGLLGSVINAYLQRAYGYTIPGLGLLLTVLLVLAVGVLSSHFFGQWFFRTLEEWFSRLPVVRRIYPSVKQLTDFLFAKESREKSIRRVVLAAYPRLGTYTMAFVTNEATVQTGAGPITLLTLLLPNPPSPFTGPLIFVPKDDVIPLDVTVEDAVKFVVSGGIVPLTLPAPFPVKSKPAL
ncbi:MAG: DUF502 domain-containing protein [Candidatus Omnitrophica bacterium]|nr:DUF502 domain-containing protein [Candidatus Omnitrophota bacterium]